MTPSNISNTNDTICAVATATGGALGIIRISGKDAITIADKIFIPSSKPHVSLAQRHAATVTYGHISGSDGQVVDDVLVSIFRAPHSYTGEDSVEISCHGSSYILQKTMQLLIDNGCRAAGPGEYTLRAFLNGKMDLSQAEAVADLIASSSEAAHRVAMNQMRGGFSRKLKELRDHLLHLTSLVELEIDFSDHEELEFADRDELRQLAETIEHTIAKLANSFGTGNTLKNGIPVAIIGETNAGKSTLLNALLNDDKAIVSDVHGTTRDVIEDTVCIEGLTFRFIDTAGIRDTNDKIEAMGIERSFMAMDKALIVIMMYDLQRPAGDFSQFYSQVAGRLRGKQVILAVNKCDITADIPPLLNEIVHDQDSAQFHTVTISAKHNTNIDTLKSLLVKLADVPDMSANDTIVTNLRHYEALTKSLEAITRVIEGLNTNLPADLLSQDLRECIYHINEILGEFSSDEVLKNIFSHFCIGK